MRAVVQRVSRARVEVERRTVGAIDTGLLVLLGIHRDDTLRDVTWMVDKVVHLRIFADERGQMNRSVLEAGGELLVVSQFTLYADTRKGRRPSWNAAAPREVGEPLVGAFVSALRQRGAEVATGSFGAMMQVALVNDGPMTVLLEA